MGDAETQLAERLDALESRLDEVLAHLRTLTKRSRRQPRIVPGEGAVSPEVTATVAAKMARGTRRRG